MDDKRVKAYLKSITPTLFKEDATTSDIIDLVKNNQIFGAVECDIMVPETLYSHFSEFSPIFRTCNVDMNDIGEHMQSFMSENHISNKPRKTLVAGMSAEKILLATPLLKFYIDHGLIVSNIYTVIEDVAKDRRNADKGIIPRRYIQADWQQCIWIYVA